MAAHAILSASSSSRWLACPPSARIAAAYPDRSSSYAEEGTRAHALAEEALILYMAIGEDDVRGVPTLDAMDSVTAEMIEAVQKYVDICIEKIVAARSASPDAQILVEQRLDFSDWAPEGFGTGDMVIVSDGSLEVVDLKYGEGVPVSAEGNTQMRLYALGAVAAFQMLYAFDEVHMTIVQPRRDSVTSDCLSVDDLLAWGDSIRDTARLAYAGKGAFCAGPHCRFCPARMRCRTLADYMLEEIQEERMPENLTDAEIADVVLKAKAIKSWLDGVEAYALHHALQGKEWPGLKLVEGRRKRTITDEHAAAMILMDEGHYVAAEIYKPQELQSLTALEKLVGKKRLAELLQPVIQTAEGKPTLVPEADKRPAMRIIDEFDDTLLEED